MQDLRRPTFWEGKVARLREWLQEGGFTLAGSYFYSDSHNDLSLLRVVENPVAVNPDPVLLAHAEQVGCRCSTRTVPAETKTDVSAGICLDEKNISLAFYRCVTTASPLTHTLATA